MLNADLIALLALFSLLFGIMNMLGGRFDSVDPTFTLDGRLLFRCLLPGLCSGAFALCLGFVWWKALYVLAAVMAGSALWFAPGWSFDEITGQWSPGKYPAFMRRFGLWLVPGIISSSSNRLRGMILKAIRGLYDALTFGSLYLVNPAAPVYLVGTVMMGPIYWACGRLFPKGAPVLDAEFFEGCFRGALIGMAISFNLFTLNF